MSRRLLRASLAAVLLLTPVLRTSAKPPDLPFVMPTPVGPLSEQFPAGEDKTPEAPELPHLLPDCPPIVEPAVTHDKLGNVIAPSAIPTMPTPPAPVTPLSLRPRELRQLKASLLFAVNPLLVLTPLMREKCDRGGDQPTMVVNGCVVPAPGAETKGFWSWIDATVASPCQLPCWLMRDEPQEKSVVSALNAVQVKEIKVASLMKIFNDRYKAEKYEEAEKIALLAKEIDPNNPVITAAVQIARLALNPNNGTYCVERDGSDRLPRRVSSPPESPAPEQLTVMPRPVTPAAPITCPYLDGQSKPCPEVSPKVDLEKSVLANLDRLTVAQDFLRKGQSCQQSGNTVLALGYYDMVCKLVPGSTLDETAEHAITAIQTATLQKPTKVIVAIRVAYDPQQLHKEAVMRDLIRKAALSPENKRELEIKQKLEGVVTIHYKDTPLAKVIDDLSVNHDFNIYIDRPALLEEGVNLDLLVSIDVDHGSLKSALKSLLDQAKLTWIIKDEVLQITTRRAGSSLETRTYPIAKILKRELPFLTVQLHGSTRQDQLIDLITRTIQPRSWVDMGGPGTMEYYSVSPGLVVYQAGEIQDQIAYLLDTLVRLQDEETVQKATRIQMTYLQRACQQALADGRLEKVADLAAETLALDESAHLLSFFGRVYLEQMNANYGITNTSLKPLDAEEESEPAKTRERPAVGTPDMLIPEQCMPQCPEKSVSELRLMWPVSTPHEECYGTLSLGEADPPQSEFVIPWCPERSFMDIQSLIGFDTIHADAPSPILSPLPLGTHADEHDRYWSKIIAVMGRPEVYNRYGCGGFTSLRGFDISEIISLADRVDENQSVDGTLGLKIASQD